MTCQCSRCRLHQPVECFYSSNGQLRNQCQTCRAERVAAERAKNRATKSGIGFIEKPIRITNAARAREAHLFRDLARHEIK